MIPPNARVSSLSPLCLSLMYDENEEKSSILFSFFKVIYDMTKSLYSKFYVVEIDPT